MDKYSQIDDIKECRKCLFELLQQTYNCLATPEYLKRIYVPFLDTLDIFHIDTLKQPYRAVSSVVNYNQWQKNAIDFISDMVAKLEKYMPSLFYFSVGDIQTKHLPATNIYTIGVGEVIRDYDASFNLVKDLLPLMVALSNFRITGNINLFPNKDGGAKGVPDIKAFFNLPDGLKMDKLADYPQILNYLAGGFNSKIRNGIGHSSWKVVEGTQLILFRYKMNGNEYFDIRLIDLGCLVIMNLLHIMEFVLLIENLMI